MKIKANREISWNLGTQYSGLTGVAVHFGNGPQPIQVAIAAANFTPSRAQLKALFVERKGNLNTLVVAVVCGDQVSLFGPDPDAAVLTEKLSTAEAILNSILEQPTEILAYQRAVSIRRSRQTTELVGFTNSGLFASHYIRSSINRHAKWKTAQENSTRIQGLRDKQLIQALGFEITSTPSNTLVLSAMGQDKRVVAILLDQNESFDSKSIRFQASPVEWSLAMAAETGAPWVIAIRDSQLRLYPAKDGVGVGQKSQAETYFEIDLLTIDEDKAGLLDLIFSAEALAQDGTADDILKNSKKFAAELGVRLRERVYESVVPELAKEIANQLRDKGHVLDTEGLQLSYELTLRVLFRLLFQAYAEDRGLLPSGRNEIFDSNSMKHWAEYLLGRDPDAPFGDSASIWFDLMQVWDAIDQGNPDMQIPAYNGGLFGSNPDLHPQGALIRTLSIPDRVLGPALRALVIDDNTEDGVPGAVDFRSLSVREFGTIYEGLLESSLSVADQDLTVDSKGGWVPAKDKDRILAKENEVYFHSASGERKATGSYYTPSFIVDHLIERSVEPALNDHLARVKELIDAGDQAASYKLFFDFRVADLAMGSAHFLVAAIDKIESMMRSFLVQPGNNIEGVHAEFIRLEEAAKNALGKDEAAYEEIERASLLRRQIARRCIYGLDINPLAVELSRLAIWIHTFVPGLPMSSLEHNLVCANSLTGIGSVNEGLNALIPERAKGHSTLFDGIVEQSLSEAKALLEEVASADEADKQQALQAAEVAKQAREAAEKTKMIFDLAVANRNGIISSGAALSEEDLVDLYTNQRVTEFIREVNPAHLPYLFPEVFLRADSGFDVLVGNPPWEEVVFDELDFWIKLRPGLKGLVRADLENAIKSLREERSDLLAEIERQKKSIQLLSSVLNKAGFPGMGTGNPDLYKAFSWRFWTSVRSTGSLGLVLPRTVLSGLGMSEWRKKVLTSGSEIKMVVLRNKRNWVFEGIGAVQSFIAFSATKTSPSSSICISGPWDNVVDWDKKRLEWIELAPSALESISKSMTVPNFESRETLSIFLKMSRHTKLEVWQGGSFVPLQGDFNQTTAAHLWRAPGEGDLEVVKGNGIQIWGPHNGQIFASADSAEIEALLRERRISQARRSNSPYFGIPLSDDPRSLQIYRSRIAFRDVVRSTDNRTLISTLIPPGVVLTNKAPYLVNRSQSSRSEAFLLGVFSSFITDWYVRCKVELSLNFHTLIETPVPEVDFDTPEVDRFIHLVALSIPSKERHVDWFKSLNLADIANGEDYLSLDAQSKIDAQVAHWFGLEPHEVAHMVKTFNGDKSIEVRLKSVLEELEDLD